MMLRRQAITRLMVGLLSLILLLNVVQIGGAPLAHAVSPDLVISQVYGGGGNSGATYTNDFIELFNRGASPLTLAAGQSSMLHRAVLAGK
ncbi:MAG: hypothetical protein H6633_15180 [Anaerolineales bacterium]|nr:hypothetical protein [Anaerolineales bacterium]